MGGSVLLRLSASQHYACALAPGSPLVAIEPVPAALVAPSVLASAPLASDEVLALAPPAGSLVLLRAGAVEVLSLASLPREEPADWIDLTEWRVVPVQPLSARPAAPELAAASPSPEVRQILGDKVPAAHPALAAVMRALQAATAGQVGAAAADGGAPAGRGGGGAAVSPGWLARLAGWLRRERVAPAGGGGGGPARPRLERLRRVLARTLELSGVARLVGRAHARYLGALFDLFESGELTEALRRAVPLGTPGEPTAPAFGLPSPRSELRWTHHRPQVRLSLLVAPGLRKELERLYRQAARRLEDRGEIEQAAFALAELLDATAEAVALLERHGRLRAAAELAEGRELPAGLVVRQWFVAGETERAVQVARRTGAFAVAVTILERQRHPAARSLRLLWAESLAGAGDFLPAVRLLLEMPEAARLVRHWIEAGIAAGGTAVLSLLAIKVVTMPEALPEVLREVQRLLLADDGPWAVDERADLARALLEVRATPEVKMLTRLTARGLLAEPHGGREARQLARQLVERSEDGLLRADLRGVDFAAPPGAAGAGEGRPASAWRIGAQDRGRQEVADAAFLPGRRVLAALGEAGVLLLTRTGHTIAHFDVPAQRLVVADHGACALALARRGELWRVSRIDLAARRCGLWWETCLDIFADSYDGGLWFVALEGGLLAIDCRSSPAKALWRIPDVGGAVIALRRSSRACSFIVHGTLPQCWRLELPALVLRARDEIPYRLSAAPPAAVGAEGRAVVLLPQPADGASEGDEGVPSLLEVLDGAAHDPTPLPAGWRALAGGPVLAGEGVLLWRADAAGTDVGHFVRGSLRGGPWTLEGTAKLAVRGGEKTFTLADERGRVLAIELADFSRPIDVRIT